MLMRLNIIMNMCSTTKQQVNISKQCNASIFEKTIYQEKAIKCFRFTFRTWAEEAGQYQHHPLSSVLHQLPTKVKFI